MEQENNNISPAQQVVIDFVGKNIDLITDHCTQYCAKHQTQHIPLDYLINVASSIKHGFITGVSKANANEDTPKNQSGTELPK